MLKAREDGAPPVSPVRRLGSLVIEGGEQPRGMARVSAQGHSPPPSRSLLDGSAMRRTSAPPSLAASKSTPWILCGRVAAQGPGVVRSSPTGRQGASPGILFRAKVIALLHPRVDEPGPEVGVLERRRLRIGGALALRLGHNGFLGLVALLALISIWTARTPT